MSYTFNPFTGNFDETKPHNLLSGLHPDSLAAAVARGSLIVGNSTPKWSAFALGSNENVLASDGTDLVWKANTGTGLNVLATTPTLVTPILGVATGTSLFNTINGIGVADYLVADDAFQLKNTTAATSGVTLQASPNIRFTAHGWIGGADHKMEMLQVLVPAISNMIDGRPGHTLYFVSTTDDGTPVVAAQLQGNGNLLIKSGLDAGVANSDVGDISNAATGAIYWRNTSDSIAPSRVAMTSPARGLFKMYGDAGTGGTGRRLELNLGTAIPTLTTCGGGSPTVGTNSSNVAGTFSTGTGGAACTFNFGAPNWTNTPVCFFYNTTDNAMAALTAASVSAFTMTVGASKVVWYHCLGIPGS